MKRLIAIALMVMLATPVWAQVSSPPNTGKWYISAGLTEDESQVKATAGVLVSVITWNKSATDNAFLKCTNATAANTTPGTTTVVYQLMIPYGLTVPDQPNQTFSTALTCYIVLGAAANAVDEVAAGEVGYTLRYR